MTDIKPAPPPKSDDRLPYRLRGQLLSSNEIALFRALTKMSEGRYAVCPKVALNDIFTIVRPNENVHYFNKIFRKHVDFLLCEPQTMKPAFGVELVKPIHKSETRSTDQFMQDLFLGAGIPLVHVPSTEKYVISDLVNLFQLAVTRSNANPHTDAPSDSVPMCPICGRMMVLRVHRDGPQKGREYYGCMDNPHCPGVVPLR
ncbi:MAG: DUF2726 domain-containing protein [Chloroflexi bacterium]|nr:DUF2726 domain-containing protein [Chloroflexota bacterium]